MTNLLNELLVVQSVERCHKYHQLTQWFVIVVILYQTASSSSISSETEFTHMFFDFSLVLVLWYSHGFHP